MESTFYIEETEGTKPLISELHRMFRKWHSLWQIEGGVEEKVRKIVWIQIIKDLDCPRESNGLLIDSFLGFFSKGAP